MQIAGDDPPGPAFGASFLDEPFEGAVVSEEEVGEAVFRRLLGCHVRKYLARIAACQGFSVDPLVKLLDNRYDPDMANNGNAMKAGSLAVVPDIETIDETIVGAALALMHVKGWSRRELAERAGLPDPSAVLTKMEKGTRRVTATDHAKLARALGVPEHVLYLDGDVIRERAMAGILGGNIEPPSDPDGGSEQDNPTSPCKLRDVPKGADVVTLAQFRRDAQYETQAA